jgi:hypothetical protein
VLQHANGSPASGLNDCGPISQYLVVYCLKSGEPSDILETLGFLQASWSINSNYSNAQYCILSGTDKPALIAAERDAIASWNKDHAEGGQRVRYVRRCRKVLFKYGQYLDLIVSAMRSPSSMVSELAWDARI